MFGVWRANRLRRAAARLSGLVKNDRGSVAIMFGLTIFVVFTIVGSAVDYGRTILAQARLQAAVDSSVLAAARVWQLENSLDIAREKAYAQFDSNKPSEPSRVVSFTPDMEASTFTMIGETVVRTPFLSFVNYPQITVATRGQALIAGGGNAGSDLEIALMLDVTGSMAGSKIEDLKSAAKDLIDIVVWADQSEFKSRVAIVPFSHAVNAGKELGSAVTHSPADKVKFRFRDGKDRDWYRPKNTKGGQTDPYEYCVSERQGSQAYTDATPTGSARLPVVYYSSASTSNCKPAAEVTPLTSDKGKLKDTIDTFKAEGFTGGNLGTAWAWYMLSPNWWSGVPSSVHALNRPVAYPPLPAQCSDWFKCPTSQQRPETTITKYAILMTDGEYNMQFCDGSSKITGASIPDRNSGPGNSEKADCTSALGGSGSQTDALCTAMKTAGVIVYTVGFGLGSSGPQVTLLRNCASDDGHPTKPGKLFYNTTTGDELRNAFRHIATSIAAPILSR
jgi:Flp pilus assembly protein TadG